MTAGLGILIVEDERIVAQDLQETLGEMGYDAYAVASSCDEAMARARERKPDVVLMDIRIKGPIDGIDTAEMLRAAFSVPVVYLTSHADEATLERAKLTEPYGYLVKPVKSSELRSVVEVSVHRHAADRMVRERERWFFTTLRSIADAVITVDPQGNISFMNPVAEALTGMCLEDAKGRPNADVVRLQQPPCPPLQVALRDRAAVHLAEGRLHGVAGEPARFISDSAAPVLDAGAVLGAVMVFRDITAQKDTQRRMELSDRMASLGTMAAGVAHEINNPLSVISTNSQFVQQELVRTLAEIPFDTLSAAHTHVLQQTIAVHGDIQSAAARIEQIVADLKVFSQPRERTDGPASVEHAVEWAVRVTRHELRHRARVSVDIGAVSSVDVDEARLSQVLVNLLMNAGLAMPVGRASEHWVRIRAHQASATTVIIDVQDTGSGMSAATVSRIFDPFFTTRGSSGGTGLGLAICQGIIVSAGGEISVESTLGVGTTFRVALPGTVAPRLAPPVTVRPVPVVRARVLVLDDEELVLNSLQRVLSRHHEVVATSSPHAALARIESGERFDVILCDLMMPDMTGPEFYAELLKRVPAEAHRLVFLTGGVVDATVNDFLASIPNHRMDKPFDVRRLLALVQEVATSPDLD
jgi:PAS domain S-box-containing protein